MFKFNFALDDLEETDLVPNQESEFIGSSTSQIQSVDLKNFAEHDLADLITHLPPEISFSPLVIVPDHGDKAEIVISRRDLFDARFQLIASGSAENPAGADSTSLTDLEYVEAPSDLVPGVYEGGLKTWECSIDLAAVLHSLIPADLGHSQRILEIGCGTAVPSIYVLQALFSAPPIQNRRVAIHLQDYNDLVFRLVTLPNAILAWYMSPASQAFRTTFEAEKHSKNKPASGDEIPREPPDISAGLADEDVEDEDILPPVDTTQPGDLPLPPSMLTAFQQSLVDYGIELRFFSGAWQTFDLDATRASNGSRSYDMVLTSETIYRTDSLGALLDLMWNACTGEDGAEKSLEKVAEEKLNIDDDGPRTRNGYLCLVAAKQVYFGVGGGITEFIRAVETALPTTKNRHKGRVETAWKLDEGVKRSVMKAEWQ